MADPRNARITPDPREGYEPAGFIARQDAAPQIADLSAAVMAYQSEVRALRSSLEEARKDERALRALVWASHACVLTHPSSLYGDDGELQCGMCLTDFRRLPVSEIVDDIQRRAMRAIARAAP